MAAAGRALERVRCLGLAIRHELAAAIKNVAPERRRVVAEALLVPHQDIRFNGSSGSLRL